MSSGWPPHTFPGALQATSGHSSSPSALPPLFWAQLPSHLSPKSHLMGTLNPRSLTLHIHIIQLQSVSPLKYFSDLYPNFSDPIALTQHSLLRTAFQPCPVYITSTLHMVGKGWAIWKANITLARGSNFHLLEEVLGLKWNLRPLFLPTSPIPASHIMPWSLDPSTSCLSTWLPPSLLPASFTPHTFHQLILLINTPGKPFSPLLHLSSWTQTVPASRISPSWPFTSSFTHQQLFQEHSSVQGTKARGKARKERGAWNPNEAWTPRVPWRYPQGGLSSLPVCSTGPWAERTKYS